MRIVIAPQSLKGSLDAPAVGESIARGVQRVLPEADVTVVPVADGGEGTVRALVAATKGELRSVAVTGPLGESVVAEYGILGSEGGLRTAVIEMASASGLPLVAEAMRDPRRATSYGTGELIRAALDAGCQELLIGIGGSATNDGGAGMAQALGARLLDPEGHDLARGGLPLGGLDRIDVAALDARLRSVTVHVACDVTNPLTGPDGATMVYGPQKGVTPEMAPLVEASMAHFAEVVKRDLGVDVAKVPGAGAAGGLGAGLIAFAGADLVPGSEVVLNALHFATRIQGADLVITAEGQLDAQTAYGKSVAAVARATHLAGARLIALVGRIALSDVELAIIGIDGVLPLADGPLTLADSMQRAAILIEDAAARALRLVLVGQGLGTKR